MNDSKQKESANEISAARGPRSIPIKEHRMESSDLFIGTKEITIAHGSEVYRLRLTAQNKLILTK